MIRTLSGRVVARAISGLLLALIVIGLGTAALLYVRERQSLDEALMAAALAEAHPWSEERWRAEHDHALVRVRPWTVGDPLVSEAIARQALRTEQPEWHVLGDRRVLLLAVEPVEAEHDLTEHHRHALLVSTAPRVTIVGATGFFFAVYGMVSVVVAAGTALLLARSLHGALHPLRRAADGLDAIRGLGGEARLPPSDVREVDRLITAANDLLERLQAAASTQRRFTAEAAHELRTPVTVLLGELELSLRQERDAQAYRDTLVRSSAQARRLRDLVEALLALARLDAGHTGLGREREHVSAVVTSALNQERDALDAAGSVARLELVDDAEMDVQVTLLRAAMGNLLRNAAVHAPGSTVVVRLHRDGPCLLVDIDDDGSGVPVEQRESVFERFQRGDRRRPGLGLGLPLAREIVRRHGGDVILMDSPEGGLRARISLPLDRSHPPPMRT